jgi:hypothetical protein
MRVAVLPVFAIVLLAGCASAPSVPEGFVAGRFVTFSCADGKSFQARAAEGGKTVRVRSHQGAAELEQQQDGRYVGDGYTLNLKAEGGVSLDHSGKSQGKACKRAA